MQKALPALKALPASTQLEISKELALTHFETDELYGQVFKVMDEKRLSVGLLTRLWEPLKWVEVKELAVLAGTTLGQKALKEHPAASRILNYLLR